jgi:hypothetical protein
MTERPTDNKSRASTGQSKAARLTPGPLLAATFDIERNTLDPDFDQVVIEREGIGER